MVTINTSKLANNVIFANNRLSNSIQRLSTGKKLDRDVPSSRALAVGYKKHMGSASIIVENMRTGKDALAVASDAARTVVDRLQSMRDLAVQATNPDLSNNERTLLQTSQFSRISSEIDDIATTTRFKDTVLTDGTWITGAAGKTYIVGPDPTTDTFRIDMQGATNFDLQVNTLGLNGLSIAAVGTASTAIGTIDTAIERVSGNINALNVAINGLDDFERIQLSARSNYESALSVVEGVDVANEMASYAKASVMQQASISMLAQGNLASQNMLALFA